MKAFHHILKDFANTVGDINEVDKILAWPLFIQGIFGQQILNPKWAWKNKISIHIFWTFLILYVFFGTVDVLGKATDVTSKGEGVYTFVVIFTFVLKYHGFITNRTRFQEVYLIAKTILLQMITKISVTKANAMMKKMQIVVKLYLIIIGLPILMYIILAISANIQGERVTLSKTTSTLMPMTSPCYEIAFILHATFLSYVTFTLCVIDMWFVLVIFFFCVSCECLAISLRVEPQKPNETNLDYATRLNNNLRIFYKNHWHLMKFFNIFRNMYKWPTIIPLFNILMSFCILIFLMSEQVQWNLLSNLLPVIVEIFAYNWFGEHLTLKAEELNLAILNFDWLSMSLAERKNYLIIITYMNREFSIKTGFGNDLSLNTMTDVLKASYQAFALLKTMKT